MTDKDPKDDNKTFDMYHIFSRWDLMLAVAFIVGLLVYILYLVFSKAPVA